MLTQIQALYIYNDTYNTDTSITRKLLSKTPHKQEYKNLNKILTQQIQQYIKKIVHHDHVGFIPGMQGKAFFFFQSFEDVSMYHINKLRNINYDTHNSIFIF